MNCQYINIHQLYDQYIYIYQNDHTSMRSWNHSWSSMIIHDLMACHVRHSDSNVSSKQQAPCHRRVASTPCWKTLISGHLKFRLFKSLHVKVSYVTFTSHCCKNTLVDWLIWGLIVATMITHGKKTDQPTSKMRWDGYFSWRTCLW